MPAKHSHHIALTGPLSDWAERQVANGDYASLSDVMRTALRLLKRESEVTRPAKTVEIATGEQRGLRG